jgi:hypothetical protein
MKEIILGFTVFLAICFCYYISDFETVVVVCLAWIISKQLMEEK